jgi:hypothetical protein
LIPTQQLDSSLDHRGKHVVSKAPSLKADQVEHDAAEFLELSLRREGLEILGPQSEFMPPFQAPDPLHKELVEIAGRDGEKAESFEQRRSRINRLKKHAAIELEPLDVAIQKPSGIIKFDEPWLLDPTPCSGDHLLRACLGFGHRLLIPVEGSVLGVRSDCRIFLIDIVANQ